MGKVLDRFLDSALGIRTGFIQTPNAVAGESDALPYAKRYHASNFLQVVRVLRFVRARYPADVFVDLGCGAGRVLVLASCGGYRSVIGVDIDANLLACASANVDCFRRRFGSHNSQVQLQNMSAGRYLIPAQNSTIFLFNPFDPVVMEQFLELNRERMQAVQVTFVCINPRVGEVLERFSFRAVHEWPHAEFARTVRVYRRSGDKADSHHALE